MRAEVAIVGAGIAGLACAHELVASGLDDVVVLEAAARCGGPIESARRGEWLIERGPGTVRGSAPLLELMGRAGLEIVRGRRAAPLVASGGRLHRLPPGPAALLRGSWLPRGALLAACAEPLRRARAGPRSVHAFVAERFGPELARRAADLLTLGSFGAPAERVGFEAAFPELARELERAGGRLGALALRRLFARAPRNARAPLVSTACGLGPLPERLATRLGGRVHVSTPVRRVRASAGGFELTCGGAHPAALEARSVVAALPPAPLAGLLELPGAAPLAGFGSTPQTLVHFGLDDRACAERWTELGFLVPTRERLPLLGCLFPSNLFAGRAPAGALLLSVFAGPELQAASDGELARALGPVLERLLCAAREPELLDVARHPAGIPLYDVGHPARLSALRAALPRGLELAGWGYDGIGLGAAAASGMRAARAILAQR
jgi:oxygen-dependent protoporphyrinogen oxidase